MANLTVKRGDGGGMTQAGWSPARGMIESMRRMGELLRWDPFLQMEPLLRGERPEPTFAPDFDVKETTDALVFRADLPGIEEKDVELTLDRNRLVVKGTRESEEEEKGETYYACERAYGSFMRAFTLPEGCDTEHVRAELHQGVLTVTVPKGATARPKKIDVKKGGEKPKG